MGMYNAITSPWEYIRKSGIADFDIQCKQLDSNLLRLEQIVASSRLYRLHMMFLSRYLSVYY